MDRISNADRIAVVLRQKLLSRMADAAEKRPVEADRGEPAPPEGIQAMIMAEDVNDHVLARAFIQTILAEEFAPEIVNEARFQRIVDQVTDAIEADHDGAGLLGSALAALKRMDG